MATINNKWIIRAIEAIGLTTKAQADNQAKRAYEAAYADGGNDDPVSGDLKSFGYNRVSQKGLRDFTKMNHSDVLEMAWILYQSNPLSKRYLEIVKDHILGRGIEPSVTDDDLRKIFSTFWERNNLDEQLPKFTIQKRLFGTQCYPVFVRKSDGRVTLAYIDPGEIYKVQTHPDNVLIHRAVILKKGAGDKQRVYRIIARDEGFVSGKTVITPNFPDKLVTAGQARLEPWETVMLSTYGLSEYTGSCFYFSINNLSNMPQGFTDLLQVADWLDADDQTLFSLADREQMAAYFFLDVTAVGATETEIKANAAAVQKRIPKKGQITYHNDKEIWKSEAPDLKQAGSIATSEALSDRVWGMLGMPKTWRGIGEGTNYASGLTMGEPTRKTLESKQDDIKRMITAFLTFVRDQAEIAGYFRPANDNALNFDVPMPEMSGADMAAVAAALPPIANALSVMVNDLRVIGRQRAAEVVSKVLKEIGVEYDPNEELAAIDAEQDDDELPEDTATADVANQYLLKLMQQGEDDDMPNPNGNLAA